MIWTAERNTVQGRLVADLYNKASEVPCDRSAVMIGGLPGADKAGALSDAQVDLARFLIISVDIILQEMAARDLIPRIARFSPLDTADLAHTEAQFIAKRLGLRALSDGRNLLWDVSMASPPPIECWIGAMKSAGYSVHGIFVDLSIEESIRRADAAHRRGHEEYRNGRGYGGRYIPAEAIRALADIPGTEPADPLADAGGDEAMPGPDSAVTDMIALFQSGDLSLNQLAEFCHARRWPAIPPACPPSLAVAASAVDDPPPYVPGSFDDIVLAYDLGHITDADYELLAWASSSASRRSSRASQQARDVD